MERLLTKHGLKLFLVLLFVCLSGCSAPTEGDDATGHLIDELIKPMGPDRNAEVKVLNFWTFHQGEEFEFMRSLTEQYRQLNEDIDIRLEYIPVDDYFFDSRLTAAFATGKGPDIFLTSPGNIRKYVEADIIQPLTTKFTKDIIDDFNESAIEGVTVDGEIYAVPFEIELLGLFYDQKLFSDHHLLPPSTWLEMMEAAEKLRAPQVSGLTIETFGSVYQTFTWLPFLWQTGADVLEAEGALSGLGTPGAIEMYTFFQEMNEKGLLNRNPSRPTNDIGILANGETAMQVSGSWNIQLLDSIYGDVDIGVVPLPTPEGGELASIAGGWKIAVNKASEHAEEASDFVMWAFAEDVENPLKWCSEVKFAYSPRRSVMQAGKEYYTHGLRAVFTDEIFGTERAEPSFPNEIHRLFNESIENILFNQFSGEAAALLAKEKIDAFQFKNMD